MVQDDEDAARLHDAPHLPEDGDGIGDRGDRIGCERLVELVVPEVHGRGVHDLERHVRHRERFDALDRLVEHLLREVDAGELAGRGVEREVEPGPDPDLEHGVAPLEVELPDGRVAAGREDPVEDEVVDGSVQLVCALDLPLLQRRVHSEPSKVLGFGI